MRVWAGLLLATVLLAAFAGAQVAYALLFGWVAFLGRVVPRMTPDGPALAVAAIAFGLFALGVHWLGRAALGTQRWRVRWALAATAAVVVAFTAGICLTPLARLSHALKQASESAQRQAAESSARVRELEIRLKVASISGAGERASLDDSVGQPSIARPIQWLAAVEQVEAAGFARCPAAHEVL